MKYKLIDTRFPYGQPLTFERIYEDEYFHKTWQIIQNGGKLKAQSKSNSRVYDELIFMDDDNNVIESPCLTCCHDWIITESLNGFIESKDCFKCKLHKSIVHFEVEF